MTQNPPNNCLTLSVLSGSMRPYLRIGGLVCIECSGAARARPGDIIVFRESDTFIAHRLLFRVGLGRHCWLYQRGDAAGVGRWVHENHVIGLVTKSTDADGTLLYERRVYTSAARWQVMRLIIRAMRAQARSVLRTLVAGHNAKR